jgi:Rrf2 family protein
MFSKACQYGLKAMIYIAKESLNENRVTVNAIKEKIDLPAAFTSKVLNALTKEGIVQSSAGRTGGFFIEVSKMKKTRMVDIVIAIDGDSLLTECALGLKECSNDQPCPIHFEFVGIRNQLKDKLSTISVYELAIGLQSEKTVLALSKSSSKTVE